MSYEVSDFGVDVLERSKTIPVVVDFWAAWCGPCKVLGPILEKLAGSAGGRWVLAKVDTDKYQTLAAQYGVRGIPNVKLFIDGKVVDEFVGALPESGVVRWLEKALPGKFDKQIEEAEQCIQQGDVSSGTTLLEEVLANEPENEHARVLLARILALSDSPRAVDLVKGIEEYSEHFLLADAVRTIGSLLQKLARPEMLLDDPVKGQYLDAIRKLSTSEFDPAVEGFIQVIKANRYYDDDGSRKACIAIFKIIGDEHEVTRNRRREFSSALY